MAYEQLLALLQTRFKANPVRHANLNWVEIQTRLTATPYKLQTLQRMEDSGGEPDVIGLDDNGLFLYCDCCAQSPVGRRNLCFDADAQQARRAKGINPAGNVLDMAADIGIDLLDAAQYAALQAVITVDSTTSSWIKTPGDIRALGGALFCDFRYGHVFTYHNGASSFFSSRGFRGMLKV
jgi:hypothetical protein